jgi:hypothetical protein
MPIKFPCENCGQVLSVGSRKAGRRAKCPKCAQPLVVPEADRAAAQMAQRRSQREAVDDEQEGDPYTQFAIYDDDDEMELVYETDEAPAAVNRPPDQNLVAVPRSVLYTQGVLLGAVALVCFALGVIVGGGFLGGGRNAAVQPIPCSVEGTISTVTSTQNTIPDDGALVFVLPIDRKPEQRAPVEGLRPQDEPPREDHPSLVVVRSINGGFARTDTEGRFRLRLPDVGDYYVLVVSHTSDRSADEQIDRDHLAELGSYFDPPAAELLGNRRYSFQRQRVRGDTTLEVVLR